MKTLPRYIFLLPLLLVFGCDDTPNSDDTQRAQQEKMSQQSNQQIGMPGIANFTEKKIMRRLYEMRDKNVATFTYMVDMNGKLHHVCDSMGYGLPYSTQFSNPEKVINGGDSLATSRRISRSSS